MRYGTRPILWRATAVGAMALALLVSSGMAHPAAGLGPDGWADQPASLSRTPNPVVGVASGGLGRPSGGLIFDTKEFGYRQQELTFAGTARSYPPLDLPPAGYASRMIVWTPQDNRKFNGTVVVEWAEVSDFGQFELTVDLGYQARMLMAEGYAFALVSAQQQGVCQAVPNDPLGCGPWSLKGADPARYAGLDHPGDAYSFDIFSQALKAIKSPVGIAPLGRLRVRTIIAEGFQPSIDKYFVNRPPVPPTPARPFSDYGPLNAYISSGADDAARLVDAFLIDGAMSPLLDGRYRVPTLHHLDESAVRWTPTPNSRNHVTWEIVGAPHADRWAMKHLRIPSANPSPLLTRAEIEARDDAADDFGQVPDPGAATCGNGPTIGSVYPRRFVLDAAVANLRTWAETGIPAPSTAPIDRVADLPTSPVGQLRRDADGNATGGLRMPVIQATVAAYAGNACIEAGTTIALPPDRLAQLYPTHRRYVERILAATNTAVRLRHLTCADAETILAKASSSTIGGPDPFRATPQCGDGLRG